MRVQALSIELPSHAITWSALQMYGHDKHMRLDDVKITPITN